MEYGRLALSRNDRQGILIDGDMYRFFCYDRPFFTCRQNNVHRLRLLVSVEQKTSGGEVFWITLTAQVGYKLKISITAPRYLVILREELAENDTENNNEDLECAEQ